MVRILHVDDDPEWIEFVREALTAEGYYVDSFSTLTEAQAAAEKDDFDVFICDCNIDTGSDGAFWADTLVGSGHRAILLARSAPVLVRSIPFLNKMYWARGEKERLVELVKRMG